jgi:uncharacterized protein (DUF1800 family)
MADTTNPRWAWEPYRPSAQSPWDLKKVGHLYRRAAFGATWAEFQAALADGPDKTIDRLLKGGPGQEDFDKLTAPLAQSISRANNPLQLPAWWLYRMLYSPHPLREKIALFWHNHFATSNAKVQNAGFMLGQYELIHRHALGSFRTMVLEMSKDPAMLVWLDTRGSKKGNPNENYARELMELFTLGVGNYTETDIREAARAFTGWEIKAGKPLQIAEQHDDGTKTVLGQTGNWQWSDIVRICLEQKSAPYFVAGKLYRWLVSETQPPSRELLEPLAEQFKKSDYDFGRLVETVLRSKLFFSDSAYRTSIKSPVDFAIGIVRALEGKLGTTALATALQDLGQNVFNPPSVKGWDGGQTWLNGQTLLFRQNLALALTSTQDNRFGRRTDPAALARQHGKKTDSEILNFLLALFLQNDVPAEARSKLAEYLQQSHKQIVPVYWTAEDAADHRVRTVCHLILTLPEFQLQ